MIYLLDVMLIIMDVLKLLKKIVNKNIKNIKIWPDDIHLIIKKFKKNFLI